MPLAYVQQQSIMEMFDLNPKDWGWILGFFGYGYLVGSLFWWCHCQTKKVQNLYGY